MCLISMEAAQHSPTGFLLRFLSGLSLANFVANQYWMSSMFPPLVVGLANAISTANLGSAAAQLLMPLTYSFLRLGAAPSVAYGAAFLLPATLQVAFALEVLAFAHDFPVKVNKVSRLDKKHQNSDVWKMLGGGLGNYRGWILRVTYGRVQIRHGANDGEHPSGVLLRAFRAGNGGGGDVMQGEFSNTCNSRTI